MKRALTLSAAILAAAILTGCGTVAIKARACKTLPDGSTLCLGTDGKTITLDLSSK